MNNKSQRNRGGRMNFDGSRNEKRLHQDRQQNRSKMNFNETNVNNEDGAKNLYKNQRMTHAVVSLVGCTVQVLVKSGKILEGILLTCSNSVDTVLALAREVKDNSMEANNTTNQGFTDKLIIKAEDVIMINAKNVDLDYAVKDSFTDTSISKYNREVKDMEMRTLQPWESDGGDEMTLPAEEDKLSNGWDAAEMFHANTTQFNVKSSYDESLEQYTYASANKWSTGGDGNMAKQPIGGYTQSKFRKSPSNLDQTSSSLSVMEAVNGGGRSHPNLDQTSSSLSVMEAVNGGGRSPPNLHQTSSDSERTCEIKLLDDVQNDDSVNEDESDNGLNSQEHTLDKQMDNTPIHPDQKWNGALLEERHSENKYSQFSSAGEHQHEEQHHESSLTKLVARSSLNPNAKVFSPKVFLQQTTLQMSLPPCPQSSSPNMQQNLMMNMHQQAVFSGPMQQFMPPPAMVFNSNSAQPPKQYTMIPKQAVVSAMRPEYAAHSTAQAATGQPLLAQNTPPTGLIYYEHLQQLTGYQIGQMMPAPPPLEQNFFSPSTMQRVPPSSVMQAGGAGIDHNSAMRQLYMSSQQGPMAAYLPQATYFASHPDHLTRIMRNNYNNQQLSPQTTQPMTAGGSDSHSYCAPSLVYMQSQHPMNQSADPLPSGTLQSHLGYMQASASSPHNQMSPYSMPMYSYPSMGHPSMQQQGLSAGQQFLMPQQCGVPTSVSNSVNPHTQYSAHFPHLHMMPPHPSASR